MSESESNCRFFLLCSQERKTLYDPLLALCPHPVDVLFSVEDLLFKCRTQSPSGVLVDIASAARLGGALLKSFFEMEVGWPRMRCAVHPGGACTVMCTEPEWTGPFAEALDSIARCDPVWNAKWHRKDFRLDFQCRVRWHGDDKTAWKLGNTLDLSCGGAFIVIYDPPLKGRTIEVEFHDLLEQPTSLRATVCWTRRWDESTALPGVGVQFDPEHLPQDLGAAIKNLIGFAALEAPK
jgi:hypothetical protein